MTQVLRDQWFSNDGTKMFFVGYHNDEYMVLFIKLLLCFQQRPGNSERFYVRNQEQYAIGVEFNGFWDKMYIIGDAGNDINEYNLSNAFDMAGASFAGNSELFNVSTYGGGFTASPLAFNNDGTKMFVVGWSLDRVLEYNLSIAFDVSSATYAGDSEPFILHQRKFSFFGIQCNGTKMFILGHASDHVHEYNLSTAFDVSSAVYAGSSESFDFNSDTSPIQLL